MNKQLIFDKGFTVTALDGPSYTLEGTRDYGIDAGPGEPWRKAFANERALIEFIVDQYNAYAPSHMRVTLTNGDGDVR